MRDIHSLQVKKSTWENARENTPLWSDWNDLQARNLTCSNFKQLLRIYVANGSYIKSISTRLTDVLLCICFWSISIASIWLRLWIRFLCVNYGLSWLVNGWLQFVLAKLIRVFITTQISTAYRANYQINSIAINLKHSTKNHNDCQKFKQKAFVIGCHPQTPAQTFMQSAVHTICQPIIAPFEIVYI